ncbi:Aux/IAA-ARF-dimerization, partial [Cynara cardunculus var. scolymus]
MILSFFIPLFSCFNLNRLLNVVTAQKDTKVIGNQDQEKEIMDLLDGSGEYTLVYEDNEGDMMLVGDVPWQKMADGDEASHTPSNDNVRENAPHLDIYDDEAPMSPRNECLMQ